MRFHQFILFKERQQALYHHISNLHTCNQLYPDVINGVVSHKDAVSIPTSILGMLYIGATMCSCGGAIKRKDAKRYSLAYNDRHARKTVGYPTGLLLVSECNENTIAATKNIYVTAHYPFM